MRYRIYSYFISLLFLSVTVVQANNLSIIKQQAQQGNAVAQYIVGTMYQQGKSVKKNKKTAVNWYLKSAKQDYILAQYSLIAMYQYGDGIEVNAKQAKYWYEQTSAARNLTLLGSQQKSVQSMIGLLRPIAIENNTDAQYLLASLYANNKQEEIANYWFLRGALSGDKDAQYYVGVTYEDKTGFFNKMQSIYWLEKSAKQGLLDAQVVLASIYEQDKELVPNLPSAAYWYEQAAEQGNPQAQSFIAGMYRDGKGVAMDKQKALMWYEKAANKGDAFSQYSLGQMYETGNGIVKDMNKAIYWYQKGAAQGHAASQLKLKALREN